MCCVFVHLLMDTVVSNSLAIVNNASRTAGKYLFESIFNSFGHRPRSGIAGSYSNSLFSFLINSQDILFSFFLSSLVWNQLLSGSLGASFPFSRSRFAVLICGGTAQGCLPWNLHLIIENMTDAGSHCFQAWDSVMVCLADTAFWTSRTSRGWCSLLTEQHSDQGPPHGLTWASDCCISFSSASSCRTAYTSFSMVSILSRNLRMTSWRKRTKKIFK